MACVTCVMMAGCGMCGEIERGQRPTHSPSIKTLVIVFNSKITTITIPRSSLGVMIECEQRQHDIFSINMSQKAKKSNYYSPTLFQLSYRESLGIISPTGIEPVTSGWSGRSVKTTKDAILEFLHQQVFMPKFPKSVTLFSLPKLK